MWHICSTGLNLNLWCHVLNDCIICHVRVEVMRRHQHTTLDGRKENRFVLSKISLKMFFFKETEGVLSRQKSTDTQRENRKCETEETNGGTRLKPPQNEAKRTAGNKDSLYTGASATSWEHSRAGPTSRHRWKASENGGKFVWDGSDRDSPTFLPELLQNLTQTLPHKVATLCLLDASKLSICFHCGC